MKKVILAGAIVLQASMAFAFLDIFKPGPRIYSGNELEMRMACPSANSVGDESDFYILASVKKNATEGVKVFTPQKAGFVLVDLDKKAESRSAVAFYDGFVTYTFDAKSRTLHLANDEGADIALLQCR